MAEERVTKLASERAVVVFTKSGCCMCHTVMTLLVGELAVSAAVHELDRDPLGREMEKELARRLGRGAPAVPAVFIGGRLVGGTSKVMAMHLKGELVPLLKNAGALWL
uniref:Glutaredoxin domain-containing protein n=1 Tax=Leersia perrieri TaxID=77586 RepID=A0A0D9XUW2_9ORYZ